MGSGKVQLASTAVAPPIQQAPAAAPVVLAPAQPVSDQLVSGAPEPSFCDLIAQIIKEVWQWICNLFRNEPPAPPPPAAVQEPPKPQAPKPQEQPNRPPQKPEIPEQCNICFDPLHIPVELDCGHILGQDCALEWYAAEPVCFLCRVPITYPKKIREDLMAKDLVELKILGVPGTQTEPITLKVPLNIPVDAIKKIAYRTFFPDAKKTQGERIGNTYLLKYECKGTIWNSWEPFLGELELQENKKFDSNLKTHTLQLIVKTKRGQPIESCDACFKNNLDCKDVKRV